MMMVMMMVFVLFLFNLGMFFDDDLRSDKHES